MNRPAIHFLLILLALHVLMPVTAHASEWPTTLPLEQGFLTIYAPQVDSFDRSKIAFRAALAYRETADADPVFGAGWFESPVELGQDDVVRPTALEVTDTRFPEGTADVERQLAAALAARSSAGELTFDLYEIEASLEASAAESRGLSQLNTDPPRIIYRDRPALLLSLDGEPVLRGIEDSDFQAVINTPYPLIFDGRHFYLNAAKGVWYRSSSATGPYRFAEDPPRAVAELVDDSESEVPEPAETVTAANAPEIVVSTVPAELIVTEGPAAFVPLVDDLLVLQNSDDDVFMHVGSQKFYIVLAGRWYEADRLDGPWTWRASDDLPEAFANIPEDSKQAESRTYVAGTRESREAVLDAQMPQTAAVERGEVDLDVQYDGDPQFQQVDGADMTYATNTGSSVILANGNYYLVDEGVWYISSSPNGPWVVSDHRPQQVVYIKPTSPVYNVRYVYVYDSTPDVVYVGYTPGYTGSYVYHNTLVYGSGWHYAPWVSPYYYYPRHSTWGFNVSYHSWSGWRFGLSWGWGPFSFGYYSGGYWHRHQPWYHRHYGRWGPGWYRPRPYHHRYWGHRGYRGHYRHHRVRGVRYAGHNLYRGDRQQASVVRTRDARYRTAEAAKRKFGDSDLYANRFGKQGRIQPDSLKTKARVRDVNAKSRRKPMLAKPSYKAITKPPASIKTGGGKSLERRSSRQVKDVAVRKTGTVKTRQHKSSIDGSKRSVTSRLPRKTVTGSARKSMANRKSVTSSARKPVAARRHKPVRASQAKPTTRRQPVQKYTGSKSVGKPGHAQAVQKSYPAKSVSRPLETRQVKPQARPQARQKQQRVTSRKPMSPRGSKAGKQVVRLQGQKGGRKSNASASGKRGSKN